MEREGRRLGQGGRASLPLSIVTQGEKTGKFFLFLAFCPEGPHLCISYLRSKRRKGEKGLGRRGCGAAEGSQESALSDLSPPRAAISR